MQLGLREISVGKRFRTNLGDLGPLSASLESIGMLHPVVVTEDYRLIAGLRRLRAAGELGWEKVPVTVAKSLTEAAALIRAEADENTCREPLSPWEAEQQAKALAESFKPPAEEAMKAGTSANGEAGGRGRKTNPGANCPRVSSEENRAKSQAAKSTGYSRRTLDKVAAVKNAAEADPKKYGDLAERLKDPRCKVDAIFKEFKRRENPPPKKAPPTHPHSDRLVSWLHRVADETHVINEQMGGIGALLKEKNKWDWRKAREYIVPMLEALEKTLREFRKEIVDAAQ